MIVWPAKDPAEVLDYSWIVPVDAGDTVASQTATSLSGSAVIQSSTLDSGAVRVWVEGGTIGETATFNLTATTAGGRTFREVAVLPVIDRASELLAMFRLRYPALASIDDGTIGYWMADTVSVADDRARLALTAHYASQSAPGSVPQGVTSFKSGTFSATVSDSVASLTGLKATIYGREFIALTRSGPRLAWTPPSA